MSIKVLLGAAVIAVAVVAAACSSDGDDGAASDESGSVTEQTSASQDQTVSIGSAELVDSYPTELALPGAELESSAQELEASGLFTLAVYRIEADTEDILDFYERAFADLGIRGNAARVELGAFGTLEFGTDGSLGSVNVEADGDTKVVSVAYLVTSGAVADASESDEPADGTPPTSDEASDGPEPDPVEEPADPPQLVSAQTLLLATEDLPERDWLAILSPSLVDEFSEATAILFTTQSCRDLSAQVDDEDFLGDAALDLDTRSFRTGGGFDFARVLIGVSVFATEAEAVAAFHNAQPWIDGLVESCFASGVAEAQRAVSEDGFMLQTSLGEAAISLRDANSLQGHAEGGPAIFFVSIDLQVHSFQRGNVVGLVSTVISGDPELVNEIPQILCAFEARILGTSPGDCNLSLALAGSAEATASSDSGDSVVADSSPGDSAPSPSTDPVPDDSADVGARVALAPVPPALIYPTGPGGWFAEEVPEGTRFVAGFNVPGDSVDDILNFYQAAFASLGATTVTAREVTPASGFLEATGATGVGTIKVIGSPSSTKAIQGSFVLFQ